MIALPAIGAASALPALSLVPGGSASALAPAAGAGGGPNFGSMLSDVLGQLSNTEKNTTNLITRAAAGDNVDIHDVMIATQTEGLAFNTAVQVRNKLVEAYQQVMQMQM